MTVKEYNKDFYPKIERAQLVVEKLESIVNHANINVEDKKEVMRSFEIRGWSEETRETILDALKFYQELYLKKSLDGKD